MWKEHFSFTYPALINPSKLIEWLERLQQLLYNEYAYVLCIPASGAPGVAEVSAAARSANVGIENRYIFTPSVHRQRGRIRGSPQELFFSTARDQENNQIMLVARLIASSARELRESEAVWIEMLPRTRDVGRRQPKQYNYNLA